MRFAVFLLTTFALALGTLSALLFAWQWFLGRPTRLSIAILAAALIVSGTTLILFLMRRIPEVRLEPGKHWMLFAAALGFAFWWIIQHARALPHGAWDAWGMWNLHARFLYRGMDGSWVNLFSPELTWSHSDYPLLLPGLVHAGWILVGAEMLAIPVILGIVLALLCMGILCCSVSALWKDQRGWLAGILILATPGFLLLPGFQMADLPFALYVLTTVVFLRFAEAWPSAKSVFLILTGLSAGLAAWTKNEGMLLVVVVLVVQMLLAALRSQWRSCRQDLLHITLGVAPMLLLIVAFRLFLAGPNDIVANVQVSDSLPVSMVERLVDSERYLLIASGFAYQFVIFGEARGGVHPGMLVVLFLLLYMPRWNDGRLDGVSLLFIPILMLAGYFMVYVITPQDLQWHLSLSLDRLMLQLWPAGVFILTTLSPTERHHSS